MKELQLGDSLRYAPNHSYVGGTELLNKFERFAYIGSNILKWEKLAEYLKTELLPRDLPHLLCHHRDNWGEVFAVDLRSQNSPEALKYAYHAGATKGYHHRDTLGLKYLTAMTEGAFQAAVRTGIKSCIKAINDESEELEKPAPTGPQDKPAYRVDSVIDLSKGALSATLNLGQLENYDLRTLLPKYDEIVDIVLNVINNESTTAYHRVELTCFLKKLAQVKVDEAIQAQNRINKALL